MTVQGLDFAKLAKRGGCQGAAYDELAVFRFAEDITSVTKNILGNTKAIKDILDEFGGVQKVRDFVKDEFFDLLNFIEKDEVEEIEEGVQQTQQQVAQPSNPPPVAKSASMKRSMKALLEELAKLTQRK